MLNNFLTFGKTIGKGAFCKVKHACGRFLDDNDEEVEEQHAIKVNNFFLPIVGIQQINIEEKAM